MSKKNINSEGQKVPTWAIVLIVGLSVILLSLIIWIITLKVGSIDLGTTIAVENWFSFLVTLIGVIITLFVGFQIFNAVEIRREIKDAEGKYEKLKNNTEQFEANFQEFQSKLEQEMVKFKLELLSKYNKAEVKLTKEQSENTRKVDWYLKDIKKDYWDERLKLSDIIEKTNATQSEIRNEMNVINEKWNEIQSEQNEFSNRINKYRNALINAFVFIRLSNDNKTLSLYAELLSAALYERVDEKKLPYFNKKLDSIIIGINEAEKSDMMKMKGVLISASQALKKVIFDTSAKDYDEIQNKIFMIIDMIKKKTNPSVE